MKLRHVRAVAVCALVVVVLTGARRGGDGGCDDDHDSSGSSGGSGGVDVVETTIPPLPTESVTTAAPTPDAPSTKKPKGKVTSAKGEVRIVGCVVEKATASSGTITFKYEVTNRNTVMAADYRATLASVDPDGTLRAEGLVIQSQIAPGATWPGETRGSYVVGAGQKAPSAGSCKVGEITKTNVPAPG
ncbi:hypothetical protein H9Y04_04880 [Streptomyces sp. TRM66268-LWL]|uniref:DUF4352 domain-containing protein n=1 Tax=Streptomyces polyasparticus TaxID=2767826 RepID=A0ABR7S9U2_9ACTN|nr:hypothetical protein [Streptomyces polyasparticus]MBC9711904.1 hypothetical protein [Streptomyces polyasparticus]